MAKAYHREFSQNGQIWWTQEPALTHQEEVVPAHRKTPSIINPESPQTDERGGNREISNHFGYTQWPY